MNSNCDENGQGKPLRHLHVRRVHGRGGRGTKTGKTTVEKMTVMADIGKINNKLVVDGQIYGGVAQGIGLALSEDFEDIRSTAPCSARHPVCQGHPGQVRHHLLRELRARHGPFGAAASANCRSPRRMRGRQRHLQRDRRPHPPG
jgi:aldehyde oxidoreductase